MAKWIPSFEYTKGIASKWGLLYDIGYNNGPLAILCHVVYATLGFGEPSVNLVCRTRRHTSADFKPELWENISQCKTLIGILAILNLIFLMEVIIGTYWLLMGITLLDDGQAFDPQISSKTLQFQTCPVRNLQYLISGFVIRQRFWALAGPAPFPLFK